MAKLVYKYIKGSLLIFFIMIVFNWRMMDYGNRGKDLDQRIAEEALHNEHNLDNKVDPIPYIYVITPTYNRPMQKAELIRMSQTLTLVKNLHWIVVEDANQTTGMVQRLLQQSGLNYTHLCFTSPTEKRDHPKLRGVLQRNAALTWIRNHVHEDQGGVVYFADDDNTYHRQLFEEIRSTKKVSVLPVGLVALRSYEGPICQNNTVIRFHSGWKSNRTFPIDMAGFAINVRLFFQHPDVQFVHLKPGRLETNLLEHLNVTMKDLEPRADMCSKVLVWHTKSVQPKIKSVNAPEAPELEV